MYLTLPINHNYGNIKKGWNELELKELFKTQGSSYEKKTVKNCFDNYEEVYLNDSRFNDLNVVSLRKSKVLDTDQDAFVIKFYKKQIGEETTYYIETGQYAGYINYNGFTIYISLSEKYNATVLNHLLTYANNISLDSESIRTNYQSQTNELEYLLCFMFLQALEKASILGLPRKYQTVNDRLASVRGKVDFNSFIKKDIPFQGKISVQYRDRIDIQEIIDVLFYALHVVKSKYSSQSLFKGRNIYNELSSKFSKIKPKSDTILKAKNHPVLSNPLFMEFKKVLELAEIIIKELSPDFKNDNKRQISGNLYNTSELFELYIEKVLKLNLNDWTLESQKGIYIYDTKFYKKKLIPDFILHKNDQYVILDAKFKTMNFSSYDVDREDIYQLHTYAYIYHEKLILSGLVYPLQNDYYNNENCISSTLDQFQHNFGIFGIELNRDSTIESIKKSEMNFTVQVKDLLKSDLLN
ncbi:McrC family protein [Kaistella carnis]|uniref:McrC family protein n=1 Tax=Kaistella carnis TaxID=1241979 RepID=UPI00289A7EC8|nr:hypothetical protein [Kaistella carnis]